MASQEAAGTGPTQTIIIASHNPVKTGAALEGFSRMFPNSTYTVRGVSVPTGVAEQPLSDKETLQGALNRVKNARALEPNADYWIGIEGGLEYDGSSIQSFAWVTVVDKTDRTGRARTAMFYLPEEISKLIRQGMELGQADDLVFGKSNSKQQNGAVGLFTDDVVDRKGYYVQAVILALIPFKNLSLTFPA